MRVSCPTPHVKARTLAASHLQSSGRAPATTSPPRQPFRAPLGLLTIQRCFQPFDLRPSGSQYPVYPSARSLTITPPPSQHTYTSRRFLTARPWRVACGRLQGHPSTASSNPDECVSGCSISMTLSVFGLCILIPATAALYTSRPTHNGPHSRARSHPIRFLRSSPLTSPSDSPTGSRFSCVAALRLLPSPSCAGSTTGHFAHDPPLHACLPAAPTFSHLQLPSPQLRRVHHRPLGEQFQTQSEVAPLLTPAAPRPPPATWRAIPNLI